MIKYVICNPTHTELRPMGYEEANDLLELAVSLNYDRIAIVKAIMAKDNCSLSEAIAKHTAIPNDI